MSIAEVKEVGDPFASLLLARGKFPRSAKELGDGIKAAAPKNDPLKRHASFVVGEGSQLGPGAATAGVERGLRFIITLGEGPDGPDVFLSVFSPRQAGGIEVMAWDPRDPPSRYSAADHMRPVAAWSARYGRSN